MVAISTYNSSDKSYCSLYNVVHVFLMSFSHFLFCYFRALSSQGILEPQRFPHFEWSPWVISSLLILIKFSRVKV